MVDFDRGPRPSKDICGQIVDVDGLEQLDLRLYRDTGASLLRFDGGDVLERVVKGDG